MTIAAGTLRHRVTFSQRLEADDEYGNKQGDWKDRFEEWCAVKPIRGTEVVMGQRLQGVQPVILTVRRSLNTACVTTGWRACIKGVTYNIRSTADMVQDGACLEMLAESGPANG